MGGYREHYYPAASRWRMRVPHYPLIGLRNGALAVSTVVKPPLYGVTLLEAVPESAITPARAASSSRGPAETAWRIYPGTIAVGRFGWQAASVSMRDQTTKAFLREMGLTSVGQPFDDCTALDREALFRWLESL